MVLFNHIKVSFVFGPKYDIGLFYLQLAILKIVLGGKYILVPFEHS